MTTDKRNIKSVVMSKSVFNLLIRVLIFYNIFTHKWP